MNRVEIPVIWVVLAILAVINTSLLISNLNISNARIADSEVKMNSKITTVGKIDEVINEIEQTQENTDSVENKEIVVILEKEEKPQIKIVPHVVTEEISEEIEQLEEIIEEPVEETIPIEEVKISKDMDLTVLTGLSRDDFIELLTNMRVDSSGFFEENAGLIYDLCHEYSINEIFFCGLIGEESGWNIAANHRRTHNYISLMSGGRLISYGSVEEGLEVAAQKLHNNYLTSGGKFYHGATLSGVKVCFCPASDTWVDKTFGRMKQVLN